MATNELDTQALPAAQVLAVYKAQGISVERGFHFLKDPLFFADSLFLKRPQRLMALLMVMGLALRVYALAERKARQALQDRGETIPNPLGQPVQRPTLRRIFQVLEGIDKILDLLGLEVKKCYLSVQRFPKDDHPQRELFHLEDPALLDFGHPDCARSPRRVAS